MSSDSDQDLLRVVFDTIPSPVLIVDDDARIQDYNRAAAALLSEDREWILRRRSGDALHCLHARDVEEGCGRGPACHDCVIRNSIKRSLAGRTVNRNITQMELVHGSSKAAMHVLVTTAPFRVGERELILLILEDVSELMELRDLIPVCSSCRKVRDDQNCWHSLEHYLSQRRHVSFSHGICPDCSARLYPEFVSA